MKLSKVKAGNSFNNNWIHRLNSLPQELMHDPRKNSQSTTDYSALYRRSCLTIRNNQQGLHKSVAARGPTLAKDGPETSLTIQESFCCGLIYLLNQQKISKYALCNYAHN